MPEHSPTPWRIAVETHGVSMIVDASGHIVLAADPSTMGLVDMQLAVYAVNALDKLAVDLEDDPTRRLRFNS